MKCLSNFLANLPDFTQLLPLTAVVAILLFLTKEGLELRRRRAAEGRKLRALKKVLARDCEINFFAIQSLSRTLTEMRDYGVAEDASIFSITRESAGDYSYTLTTHEGAWGGGVLRSIRRDSLLKHMVEIASFDGALYSKCESALDGLTEADHVYLSTVHGPGGNFPSTKENYYDGLIEYGIEELERSTASLKGLYRECTGSELTKGKLR